MDQSKKDNVESKEENPLKNNEPQKQKKSFKQKLCHVGNNITVEPLLAGMIIPSIISRFAMTNLNLDKACRVNLNFGDELCEALVKRTNKNSSFQEQDVQKLIASIDIWKSILNTSLPCIIIMFLGAWSDRTGKRKICILLPMFGECLTSLSNLVNVYYFYEIPVQWTVFMETIFPAMTGGWVTMFLGVFSYISDITSEESRTFRVGLVNFCMTAGVPVGIALSGFLVTKMGYYGLFTMTTSLFLIVLSYGLFCLKEPDEWLQDKKLPLIERSNNKDVSFFDVTHVYETIGVAFKERQNQRRMKILLTLFSVFVVFGPMMAEHSVFYLFVRNRLNWDMVKFGLYSGYSIVLHSIGAIFSITVLSKRFKMEDSLLCLISISSKFVGCVWTAFALTDIEMYLVPVVEMLGGVTITSLRSIISKLVEKNETAKVNSLFSLTETLASLVFVPFYSWLYMKTLSTVPGTVFLTSASCLIPASVVLLSFYIQKRKESRSSRKLALKEEEKKDALEKKTDLEPTFYKPDEKGSLNDSTVKTKL